MGERQMLPKQQKSTLIFSPLPLPVLVVCADAGDMARVGLLDKA